ncbi:MAG: metallophosphoesterase family protein [Bacteroidales bacterium]|nr:metallophosphoesterase family protein [Bacteroidales bacterium]
MIKTILHLADLHIPNEKQPYRDMIDKLIEQVILEVKNPEETRIVIVGDIFCNKIRTSNEAKENFHHLLNFLDKICPTYIVAGNHDMLEHNRDRMDSISPTFAIDGAYTNVTFIDKELDYKSGLLEDENVIFALYSMFDGFSKPNMDGLRNSNPEKKFIGLYHGDIAGSVTDLGRMSDCGIDTEWFKDCDCVMAGHIHRFQEIKKNGVPIVYPGSVFQQDFGENTTGHGFVIWNLENMTHKHVEVTNEYRMFKFSANSYEDIDMDIEKLLNL